MPSRTFQTFKLLLSASASSAISLILLIGKNSLTPSPLGEFVKQYFNEKTGEFDLDRLEEDIVNEGLLGSIIGGLTGFALGKSVGKMLAKVLGIQKGIFYDLLTSRLVGAALGAAFGKRF